jgi:hypothetical protein
LLGEAEKARCALLMEHRGVVPAPSPESSSSEKGQHLRRQRRSRDDDDESDDDNNTALSRHFDAVQTEVAKRERFLETMRSIPGALRREHVEAVRLQVASRLAEMRALDARMRRMAVGSGEGEEADRRRRR